MKHLKSYFSSKIWVFAGLVAGGVGISRYLPVLPQRLQDAATIAISIVVEALPFIVLGVLVSALLRKYVTPELVARVLPKSPFLSLPLVALFGMAMPVCECGNLPVTRQLIRGGLRPALAITFFLSAPILNPAVLISTIAAFPGMPEMVIARMGMGWLVAVLVGGMFLLLGDSRIVRDAGAEACLHHHNQVDHIKDELIEMLAALAIGSWIAGCIQVFVPRSFFLAFTGGPEIIIAALLLLSFLVSLCSTVDAFFARSLLGLVPASSLIGFLVMGPMIDVRGIALLSRSFTPKAIAQLAFFVVQLVFIFSLILHYTALL